MGWRFICVHVAPLLAVLCFVLYGVYGCDGSKEVKDRVALLACVNHGGIKVYKPKGDHLEVVCKDGFELSVKWLPSK